jgi:hypothetical protein
MPYLSISVTDTSTLIHYIVDGEVVVAHTHDVGLKQVEADGLSKVAASRLIDGVLYTLEFISLHDRIPTDFHLVTSRYGSWLSDVLESASYTQFFTDGKPVRVTIGSIKGPSRNYARHTKTVFSFKI